MFEREAAPLRAQAVEFLRSQIVSGAYAPGVRLTEKALCEAMQVSRTVVREALRQLESEKLIDMRPNVGPIVRELEAGEVEGLYDVRAALEALAGRLAAAHATAGDVEELRLFLARLDAADTIAGMLSAKANFYATLVRASGNSIIGDMLDNVQARVSQLRGVTMASPGRKREMMSELEAIVEAIGRGDELEAESLCLVHVRAAREIATAHLKQKMEKGA